MTQQVVDGICMAIAEEFQKEGLEIYTETAEQELKEPCFSVLCIHAEHEQQLGSRYQKEYQFSIQYFPEGKDAREECHTVEERLCSCLEMITVQNGKIRGTGMEGRIVDGVLVFLVNFGLFLCTSTAGEDMAAVNTKTKAEGG